MEKTRNEKGHLLPGHGGLKPKGAISEKVKLWDQLGNYVVTQGAERAMQILARMDDDEFLKYYLTMLEFFKPKQARVTHAGDAKEPVVINMHGNL
jgi:hypothetical protein